MAFVVGVNPMINILYDFRIGSGVAYYQHKNQLAHVKNSLGGKLGGNGLECMSKKTYAWNTSCIPRQRSGSRFFSI
jgi:hypothetical protein